MDLSREKIIFKAAKPWDSPYFPEASLGTLLVVIVLIIAGGMWAINFLSNPQGAYHDQDAFLLPCFFGVAFASVLLRYKMTYIQQFYIVEHGVIVRNGFTGKWYKLSFDNIASVAHVTSGSVKYKNKYLVILCQNHAVFFLSFYKDNSIDRAAEMLKDRNLPLSICTTYGEMKQVTAGYTAEKAAEWQEASTPSLAAFALHRFVPFLPLFTVVCLCIAGMLNAHCGMQKNIVVRGTIVAEKTHYNRRLLEDILVRSSQGEQWFPVNSDLIGKLHTGEQMEVHYKKGCAGLDYGLAFKKIK